MRRILATALTLSCFLISSAWACPNGEYDVEGWNPGVSTEGAPSYQGTAIIKTVGDTCVMDWRIGQQRFGGVGMHTDNRLDIAYADLNQGWFGLVSYRQTAHGFTGQWAVYGASDGFLGKENLRAR